MHPISFDIDYALERNRLTAFFRLIVAIPWIVVAYLYGIAAYVVAFVAWFALLFTKRYPEGLYNFIAGYVRFTARVGGFAVLATDELPPFGGSVDPAYPVKVDVAPPQSEYSRAKTFFKLILAFPQQLITYGLGFIIYGAAFVTWFRILFTGKQSATMHDALKLSLAYVTRASAFLLLLTETHPRLLEVPRDEYPPEAPALPPAAPTGGPAVAPLGPATP
jgi:hypothetical protein